MKSKDKSKTHIYIENKSIKSQLCGTQPSRKEQQFTKITQNKFLLCFRSLFVYFTWEPELGSNCKQCHFLRLTNFKFLIKAMNLADGAITIFNEFYITS